MAGPHSHGISEMKDIILTCASEYDATTVKPWINSLERSGFGGDIVVVAYPDLESDAIAYMKGKGCRIIPNKYPKQSIVVSRFLEFWHILSGAEYRFAFCFDIRDVVFQSDPVRFLEENLGDKSLLVGSEAVRYPDEPWNSENMQKCFGKIMWGKMLGLESYNAGTIAGKAAWLSGLCLTIYLICQNNPHVDSDQAAMNLLLSEEPYKSATKFCQHDKGWACAGGAVTVSELRGHLVNGETLFDRSTVKTKDGKDFCIVHQYDRKQEWKQALHQKYGE